MLDLSAFVLFSSWPRLGVLCHGRTTRRAHRSLNALAAERRHAALPVKLECGGGPVGSRQASQYRGILGRAELLGGCGGKVFRRLFRWSSGLRACWMLRNL